MKKSIPKRILSVFLALLMFFTTFPVGAIQAFANVASGQITISNGKKYKVAWNYNYGKNENGKIRIPEYSREIAGNKAGAGTTNLLRKYVSSDLSGSEKNAGKDEVPIFRLSRSYGYTSDESGASAVTTINVDPNKITDFINAAKSDGIKLPEKRARRIYYVLLNGFKQFTTNSGDQFYREQLYFIATQCILWELDEGKRVGFGNDTKWTDVRSKSYKANAKNKERSQDIVGSYSKSIDASYRYYWHDFYYTVKNKYFNSVKDCPDYYNEILEAAEMQMYGQQFQYKSGSQWRNFSDLGSNDYTQMAWNNNTHRYEATYYVSKKFLGTGYGKYDPNKIVLPIRNSDGSVFTTTFTGDVKVYSQATTQSKVICNVNSAMRSGMVTTKNGTKTGVTVLGKTRNGEFYCVYFGKKLSDSTWYGYVPVSSAKLKTKPSEPFMKVEVSGNKLTFYTSRRSNVSVNLAWHMNAPDIYNKATYFQGKDKTAGVKGYICGGRYGTVRVLFNLNTVAHKAYLKCSDDGTTLKTIAVAHGETVAGSYFNDQEKTHPQKHNNYKYTYSYKHWSASKNGSKMTNPAPSQKKIYGDTTFWMCLNKKENAKGRAVYCCGLCGAQLYDTSTSTNDKEHYAGGKYTIPTGSKHVCSVNGGKITYNGKTIDVGDYSITFQGWGQDSNANVKLATGTLNDSLSVLSNHKAGSSATVPSSTLKYYAKYTLKLTNENKVLFKCSIDENEIALLRGAPGSTQGPVPSGESHKDSSNLSNLQYKGHPLSDYKITFSYWGTNPDYTVNDKSDDTSLTVGSNIAMPNAKMTVYYAKYTFTLQSTVNFVCALCGETISSTTTNAGQTISAPSVTGHNCAGTTAIAGLSGNLEDLNRTFKGWGATADNYDYAKDQVTTIKTPAEGEVTYYAQWQLQNNISAAGSLSGIDDLLDAISNYESNYKDATIDPNDDQAVAAAADAKEAAEEAQKKISKWVGVSDSWTLQEGSNKAIKPSGQAGASTDYANSVETDMYVTDNNSLDKVVTVSIPKSTGYKIVSIVVDDGALNKDGSPVGSRTLYPQNSEQFYKMSFNTNVASLKASDIHVTFAPVSDSKVILNYVALTDSFDYDSSSIYEDNTIVSSKVLDWDAAKAFSFKGGCYEDSVEETDADGNTTTTTENVPYFKESVEYGGSTCDYVGAYGYTDVFGNYQHKEVAGEPDFTVDEMHGTLNVYLYYMPKGDGEGGIEYNLFARGDEAVKALDLLNTGSRLLLYRSKSLSSLPVNADELFDNINEKCGSKFSDYLTAQNYYAWKCSCGNIVENASVCPDCGKSIDDQGSVPEFWVVPEAWQCSECGTTNSGLECDGEKCTNTYMQQTASSKSWKCSTCGHSNSTLTCQGSTYDVELVKDITANVSKSRANVNAFKEYPNACEGHEGDSPYSGSSVSLIRCSKCHKWFSDLGVSNGRHTSTAYIGSPSIGYSKTNLALCGGGGTADQSDTAYVRTGGSLISSTIATGWQCSVCGTKYPAGRAHCGHSIYPDYVTVSLPADSLTSGYYYYFVIKDNKSDRYYYNDEVTGGSVRYTNNHLVYNAEAYYGDQLNQIKVYDNTTFNSKTPAAGARVMVLSESKYKELVGLKSADDLTWTCYGCSYKECSSCKEKNAYDAIVCANCGAWLSDTPTYKTNPYNEEFCSTCDEPRNDPDLQILKTDENGSVLFYGDSDTYKFFIMPEDFTVSDATKNIKDYNEIHLNYYTYEESFKTTPKAFETVSEKSVVSSLEEFQNANTAGQKSIVGKTYLTEVDLYAKDRIDLRLHTLDKSTNLNPEYKQSNPVENVSMSVYKMDSLGVYQSIEKDKVLDTSKDFDFYSDDGTYLNYSYYPAEMGTYKFEFFFIDQNGERQKVWATRSGSVNFKENVQQIKYTGKYAKLDYYLKKQTNADSKTVTTFFDSVDRSYNESGVSFFDNDNIVYSLYTKNEKDELVPYTTLDLNKIGVLAELSQKVSELNAQKEADAKNFSTNTHPSFNKSYTYHDDATNDNFTITVDYQDYSFFSSKASEFANRWGECHNPYSPITEKKVTNAADALAAISNITPIKKYYISITTKSPEDLYYSVSCDGFTSNESSTVFKVDSKSLADYEYSADTEGTVEGYNALSDYTALHFEKGKDALLNISKGDQTQASQLNGIITTSNGLPIIGYDGVEYNKLFDQFMLRGDGSSTIALKDHINEDQINSLQSVLENDMLAYGVMLEYYPTGKPATADAERAWDADGMDSTQNKYSVIKSQYNMSKTGVMYKDSMFDYANKSVLYFGDSAEGATPGALYDMLCDFSVRHQAADRDGYIVLKVLCSETTIDIYATDLATKYSVKNSLQSTSPVINNPFVKSSNMFLDGVPSEFVGVSAVEFKENKLKSKVTNIDNLANAQVTNRDDAQNATARVTLDNTLRYFNLYTSKISTPLAVLKDYNVSPDGNAAVLDEDNNLLTDADGYIYTLNANCSLDAATKDGGKSNFIYVGYKLEDNDGSNPAYPKNTHPYKMSVRLLSSVDKTFDKDDRRLFGLFGTSTRVAENGTAANNVFTFKSDVQGSKALGYETVEHYTAEMDLKTYQIKTSIQHGTITNTVTGLRAGSYKNVTGADSVVTFTPEPGYQITSVKIDGKELASGEKSSKTAQLVWTGDTKSGKVAISGTLTADHTVDVVCSRTYTITTSITNGTITDTITKIKFGETKTIEFTPDDGFMVSKIVVDKGLDTEKTITDVYKYWSGGSYIFENITADHSFDVECTAGIVVNTYLSKEAYEAAGGSTDPIDPLKRQVDLLPFAVPDSMVKENNVGADTMTEIEFAKMLCGSDANRDTIDENSWAAQFGEIFALSPEEQIENIGFAISSGVQANTKISSYYNKEDFPFVYSYYFPKELLDSMTDHYSEPSTMWFGCGPSGTANLKYQLCYETPDHKDSDKKHISLFGGAPTDGSKGATYSVGCYVNEKYLPVDVKFQYPNAKYSYGTDVVTSFIVDNQSGKDFTDQNALNATGGLYAKLYNLDTGELLYEAIENVQVRYDKKLIGRYNCQYAARTAVVPAEKNNLIYYTVRTPAVSSIDDSYESLGYKFYGIVPWVQLRYNDEESGQFVYCDSGLTDKNLVALNDLDDTSFTNYEGYNLNGGDGYSYKDPTNNKPYANITSWQEYTCENGEFKLHTYTARLGFQENLLKPLASTGAGSAQNPSKKVESNNDENYWETKSGYGLESRVTANLTPQSKKDQALPDGSCVNAQSALAFYPEYNYEMKESKYSALYAMYGAKSTPNDRKYFGPYASVRPNCSNTNENPYWFKFMEYQDNGSTRSLHHIPVWYPNDTDYKVQVRVADCWTPSGMLSYVGDSNAVKINGSLFDDFKTRETSPW